METPKGSKSYRDSGVDMEKGERLVRWLQKDKGSDEGENQKFGKVIGQLGGFSALFRPDFSSMKDPLLVSGTDGVGTKLLLALQYNNLTGLGQDLVAMCVNDLYTLGASPLFFLDYYATGQLREEQFQEVLRGIKSACNLSQCSLVGGETAELPGLYGDGHFDLAGFVVGVVDGAAMLGPQNVEVGDALIGIGSSGFHSNGYSLLRSWIQDKKCEENLISRLLEPTQIYHQIPTLLKNFGTNKFHALAHITGGGISGNLPRVLPNGMGASITHLQIPNWQQEFIEEYAKDRPLAFEEVFNLGAGMVAVVSNEAKNEFLSGASELGLNCWPMGQVENAEEIGGSVVYSKGVHG